jgi:hypothetical protein
LIHDNAMAAATCFAIRYKVSLVVADGSLAGQLISAPGDVIAHGGDLGHRARDRMDAHVRASLPILSTVS